MTGRNPFVSISLKMKVEVEALNMVEAVGAYTRHRTVPVLKPIIKDDKVVGYRVIVVPAVSGQSIAHGYQKILIKLAEQLGLPVCPNCSAGEFSKHSDLPKDARRSEKDIIQECVNEDITGFLAPNLGIRRTSRIYFSYLVPDVTKAEAGIEPQFHVRYSLSQEHQPFNIESGTAVYTMNVGIDVAGIGVAGGEALEDRATRIEVAFKALAALIEGLTFGAKKARYLPIVELLGAVAAVSDPIPFMVSVARGTEYLKETVNRAVRFKQFLGDGEYLSVYYLDKEGIDLPDDTRGLDNFAATSTFTELVERVYQDVRELLGLT